MAIEDFGVALQLGRHQPYVDQYDAALLQPIPRQLSRQHLPVQDFRGCDIWTAYEVSWLDVQGKPQVAIAEFIVPAASTHIIESKSFKYYLNSLNQTRFASLEALQEVLSRDLSAAAGSLVDMCFYMAPQGLPSARECQARLVDDLPLRRVVYAPDANLLQASAKPDSQEQVLCSHLLKSNCPVTGQPDWASLWVGFAGIDIVPESFLAYVVSYRQHQDFHENCVEQIFADIWQQCQPQQLWVYARYTRRGGLDINPFRSSDDRLPPVLRGFRQ